MILHLLLQAEPIRRVDDTTGYRRIEGRDIGQAMDAMGQEAGLGTLIHVGGLLFLAAFLIGMGLLLWKLHRNAHPPDPPPLPSLPENPGIREIKVESDEPPPPGKVEDRSRSRWRDP